MCGGGWGLGEPWNNAPFIRYAAQSAREHERIPGVTCIPAQHPVEGDFVQPFVIPDPESTIVFHLIPGRWRF